MIARILSKHSRCSPQRSWLQLLVGLLLFGLGWSLACYLFDVSWLLTVLVSVPTAGMVLRLFMIQHDCGHQSFFGPGNRANHVVGRLVSLVTAVPYDSWRRDHHEHHATSGNLDRRGTGDITTVTRGDYQKFGKWRRLLYRVYRHPVALLGLGPLYFLGWKMRLPNGRQLRSWVHCRSILLTNLALLLALGGLGALFGFGRVLLVHGVVTYLASCAGIWFFYVQHQFEHASWKAGGSWDFHEEALWGSSYYDLPPLLRWLSANIGIHHVHHLCTRIPNYRLPETLRTLPELRTINRFSLRDSLRVFRFSLWDSDQERMIPFREVGRSSL